MFFVYRKARLLFLENSSSLSSESILLSYSRKNNSQVSTTNGFDKNEQDLKGCLVSMN
jgi:hypothetical protein